MRKLLILLPLTVAIVSFAQETVQPFELVNIMDGKAFSVKPCRTCKAVVAIFNSVKCPYDQHYRDRIKSLIEKFGLQVTFVIINSNPGLDEGEAQMKQAYKEWGISVPYLSDKKQIAMNALHATRTPETVLLIPSGNALKIVYHGAIDDNAQVRQDTSKDFLSDAIGEVLAGKPVSIQSERVIGCTIRKG